MTWVPGLFTLKIVQNTAKYSHTVLHHILFCAFFVIVQDMQLFE